MSSQSERLDGIERDIDQTRHRIDSTLDALSQKLSPNRLAAEALDAVRANGGEFAGNMLRTAKENPVALAMLAGSFAWLMMSDRRRHAEPHRAAAHDGSHAYARPDPGGAAGPYAGTGAAPGYPVAGRHADAPAGPAAVHSAGSGPDAGLGSTSGPSTADRARSMAGSAGEAAGSAVHGAADAAHRAGQAAKDAAGKAGGAAAGTASAARAAAGSAADSVRAAAHDLRDGIGGVGRAVGERSAEAYAGARDVTRRAGEFLAENPLMVGAIGLALGGLVAAVLPATRREDEWLGETGDRVRGQAAEAVREAAREGRQVAEAAAGSAAEEARRQKLTPEEAGRSVQQTAEQVARGGAEVAKAAVRAAEEETRRRTGNGAPRTH